MVNLHNDPLQLLVELGIPGAILHYASKILLPYYHSFCERRMEQGLAYTTNVLNYHPSSATARLTRGTMTYKKHRHSGMTSVSYHEFRLIMLNSRSMSLN